VKSIRYFFINVGLLLSAFGLTVGCSTIDDDLSDCGNTFELKYQLRLVTNMTTELETHLKTVTELSVADSLQAHLKDIFTDFAHDVDLSFYDTEGALDRLQHDQHIMDANQSSYTLTLPMRKYMHLAIANIANNDVVSLEGDEYSKSSTLQQANGQMTDGKEFLTSHTTGLFTARQPMEVLSGVDQTFNVHLYMANSAATLVLDPKGQPYSDIKVYTTVFANAFSIRDSSYVFTGSSPLVIADQVETGCPLLCFCSVNFPSRDAVPASARSRAGENPSLWQMKVYLTKQDGSITETILDIDEPLKAGELKIIKGELDENGAVRPYNSTVGVSVTLNWNNAGDYVVPL
jgi:hypothetical protein